MQSIFNVLSIERQREHNRRRSLAYKFKNRIDYNSESDEELRKRVLMQLRLSITKNYPTKSEIIKWRVENAAIL